MKIQKINIVSESLKQLVAVLKDAEASTEAINLLGNLDPEFKRDADYLRDLLRVIETDTVKVNPIIPPEPIIIPVEEPEEEPEEEVNDAERFIANADEEFKKAADTAEKTAEDSAERAEKAAEELMSDDEEDEE